jgi:predicted nucleotide-binding protein
VTPAQRNQDARKLLAYFYATYEKVGGRNFYISPQEPNTLTEVEMTEQDYHAAMNRLKDKRLLKAETLGGGCSITDYGVQASEGEALLDHLLPVAKPSAATSANEGDHQSDMATQKPDPKKVFIIHGRNVKARAAVEQFVRALGLTPIDFEQLAADSGAAFIGEIVRSGLSQAQGIIALFTADEIAHLRPDYHEPHDGQEDKERWQSRPNVIFEAGMAYGMAPERTILAMLGGQTKLFSDVRGMHLTYLSNNRDARKRLRQKLIGAKCDVDQRTDAYDDPTVSGDFDSCVLPEVSVRPPFRE